jgi:hypothetical protein
MMERFAWLRRRTATQRWLLVTGSALVVAVAVGWAVWPSQPAPRARQYLEFTACLLTDDHGITGPEAAPVWAGMQEASLATRAKVQFASVVGRQSVENAVPFLTGSRPESM